MPIERRLAEPTRPQLRSTGRWWCSCAHGLSSQPRKFRQDSHAHSKRGQRRRHPSDPGGVRGLDYWRSNSYPIAFQNHTAGFVISAERIHINGYGTGKINASGNTWYTAEEGETQPGRPMPFVFGNVSDVLVEHCGQDVLPTDLSSQCFGLHTSRSLSDPEPTLVCEHNERDSNVV